MFEFKLHNEAFLTNTGYDQLPVSPDPNYGYKPVELFISSLVGCSGGVFRKILEKKRIKFDTIMIKADVERDIQQANKITKIHLNYIVEGNNLSYASLKKSLDVTMKNCGMIQSVIGSIKINETLEINDHALF